MLATHASLLERLKDLDDQGSWQEFYTTYRKLILSFALRHGLTMDEAEEVLQETIISLARNLPKFHYDQRHCSFKSWLLRLTLWRIKDQLRKRRPRYESPGRPPGQTDRTATVERIPAEDDDQARALWDAEWDKHLFDHALQRVKKRVDARQFQIFDLYVFQEWPAGEVARSLGISRGRVYVTKHRLSALLRKELQHLAELRAPGETG